MSVDASDGGMCGNMQQATNFFACSRKFELPSSLSLNDVHAHAGVHAHLQVEGILARGGPYIRLSLRLLYISPPCSALASDTQGTRTGHREKESGPNSHARQAMMDRHSPPPPSVDNLSLSSVPTRCSGKLSKRNEASTSGLG
ncbi:hypothetical protein BDW22DRAFT_980 [Trametopsis cervina]|nr:hypothetical protein BDW22DRAFT_980 [Trametopsis cervina]